jgi:hypothetical protein
MRNPEARIQKLEDRRGGPAFASRHPPEAAALLSERVANVVVTAGGLGLAVIERGKKPRTRKPLIR